MDIQAKYSAKPTTTPPGTSPWEPIQVEVFQNDSGGPNRKIGEYGRNFPQLFDSFLPFRKGTREFALYSRDYTLTRVMELPSCEDLGGEDPNPAGFCPSGFYVPDESKVGRLAGSFGFVCGCVWGDDSRWKVQYLDLSKVEQGIIARDDRFGHIAIPRDCKLSDSIQTRLVEKDGTAGSCRLNIQILADFDEVGYRILEELLPRDTR